MSFSALCEAGQACCHLASWHCFSPPGRLEVRREQGRRGPGWPHSHFRNQASIEASQKLHRLPESEGRGPARWPSSHRLRL